MVRGAVVAPRTIPLSFIRAVVQQRQLGGCVMACCDNCGVVHKGALGDSDIIEDGISVFPYAWGHYGGLWDYFPQEGDYGRDITVHMCRKCALSLFRQFPALRGGLPNWVVQILDDQEDWGSVS